MLCAVDFGNTTVTAAFRNTVDETDILTFPSKTESLNELISFIQVRECSKILICSVNPSLSDQFVASAEEQDITVNVFDYMSCPLKIQYNPASEAGSDRLAAAFAVNRLFNRDAVVIDIGTAVTFEAVRCDGVYLGGCIYPGLSISSKALNNYTAQLPLVTLEKAEEEPIGINTSLALKKGLFFGLLNAVKGTAQDVARCFDGECMFVVTGGDSALFSPHLPSSWTVMPNLITEGLFLWEKETDQGQSL